MAKEIDLDNLTKEDFIEMAKYCHQLELQVQELKGYCITLKTQRVNADNKVQQLKEQLWNQPPTIDVTPIQTTLEINTNLTNPEQYKVKKQF